ncbi:Uncharacterised protein [Mycobacteroides abscessus subsp. abscessus]|nr:Uncharacterised protein [Mycobacteroides abscessus subsp. abscessus]
MTDPNHAAPDLLAPALPAWAERELAERRRFWAALRDGGVVGVEDERAAIEREVRGG